MNDDHNVWSLRWLLLFALLLTPPQVLPAQKTVAAASKRADSSITVNGQLTRTVDIGSGTPRWILKLKEPLIYGQAAHRTIEVDLQGTDLEKLRDKKVHIMGRIESQKGKQGATYVVLRAAAITLGDNRPTDSAFYIHDLGHRCWDFGAEASWAVGKPVYIYSCNGSVAQQVRVRETDSHDVHLGVKSLFCIGVRGGKVIAGAPLELQVCDDTSPAQRFAVDGDAVLMGSQSSGMVTREFVIAPQLYKTPSTTPLVVSVRTVSDAEYFRFEAVDRSGAPPTSGFVHIFTEVGLDEALGLGWGTVIEIDDQQPLELKGSFPKVLHGGTTLRGYRKYTFQGPEEHTCTQTDQPIFMITEDNVRITGFRLRGPFNDPRCQSSNVSNNAIQIRPTAGDASHVPIAFVDHLDIGYFTASAVDAGGTHPDEGQCPDEILEFPRSTPVRVIGNFFHNIERHDPFDQMGSVTGNGAFILNQGNMIYRTYDQNIAADAAARTGYNTYDNFFLSNQRVYQVDMHSFDHHDGSLAGDYFDVGWNTFLDTAHHNIIDSGTPCRFTAIHHNIFLQSESQAIVTATKDLSKHVAYANTFNASNPTDDLAVGDFDGDRMDDVFVGTGAAWYSSSGAQSEWRFLNRMPEHASELLFGDFDGDGRTDVIALHAGNIDISWGALSPWQTINATASTLGDLAVVDFDGDRRADLFLATGTEWFWAPGGKNWISLGPSSDRRAQLLFGDFSHAGHTQILRIHGGHWDLGEIVSGTLIFNTLNGPAQADSVDGLVVGDFEGSGFADEVARTNPQTGAWEYTRPTGFPTFADWRPLRNDPGAAGIRLAKRGVAGRFLGSAFTDIVVWQGVDFYVAPSGRDPLRQISRQDMR